jgi:hypothetical protein
VSAGLRALGWLVFWATLLVAVLLGLFVAWVLTEGLPPGTVITIDGERFVVPALQHFGHWFLAVVGVLIAALVLVVVLPLVVVLVLLVPVAVSSLGIAVALALLALLLWPLVLLARRLWRRRDKPTTIAA